MARASTETLLSLDRFAFVMGLDPLHFNGAVAGNLFAIRGGCRDFWYPYAWMNDDKVGWEELGDAIYQAEEELSRLVGFWPSPKWTEQELHMMPRYHRRDLFRVDALDVRGQRVGVKSNYGRFIIGGRKATTSLGGRTVAGGGLTYLDQNGDGLFETARIRFATTLTNACEIRIFHDGYEDDPTWEIRPARSASISGGIYTGFYDAWMFIDPDLLYVAPEGQDAPEPINIFGANGNGNYVTRVNSYRVYNDWTQAHVEFFWEPSPPSISASGFISSSCDNAAEYIVQNGALHARDPNMGFVIPQPATYDTADAEWDQVAYSRARDPDFVHLYYLSGDLDQLYLTGRSCNAMSRWWEQNIAWLAVTRLEYPICACGAAQTLSDDLRVDLAVIEGGKNNLFQTGRSTINVLDNPLGTHVGEVRVWRRIKHLVNKRAIAPALV